MLAFGRGAVYRFSLRTDSTSIVKKAGQRRNLSTPLRNYSSEHSNSPPRNRGRPSLKNYLTPPATLLLVGAAGYLAYEQYQPFRHTVLAVVRCSRIAGADASYYTIYVILTLHIEAAVLSAADYKITLGKAYASEEAGQEATSACHTRSARRVLKALLANGGMRDVLIRFPPAYSFDTGIFIKLGQHMASL